MGYLMCHNKYMNSKRIATAQATPKHTIHIDADAYGWHVINRLRLAEAVAA